MTRPLRSIPATDVWTRRTLLTLPDAAFDELVTSLRAERETIAANAERVHAAAVRSAAAEVAKSAAARALPTDHDHEPYGHPQPQARG
jgi:hypothetical protein